MSINTKNSLTLLMLTISLFMQMQAISLLGINIPLSLTTMTQSTSQIGIVMALYSVGLIIGGVYGKKIIQNVGHIRAFASFGAISTIAAILHTLTVTILAYAFLRLISGIAAATMLIVIESWFNTLVKNNKRGRLLAIYQMIFYCAMGSGQLLINIQSENNTTAFLISALLSSLSFIPLTLININNPTTITFSSIKIYKIFKLSPQSAMGAICAGFCIGSLYNLIPVYAKIFNITTFDISVFTSVLIFSGILLQKTMGKLADQFNNQTLLIYLLISTGFVLFSIPYVKECIPLPILAIFIGSLIACLYPVSARIIYNQVDKSKSVAASSALICAYAIGGGAGPIMTSIAMELISAQALFSFTALFCLSSALIIFIMKLKTVN